MNTTILNQHSEPSNKHYLTKLYWLETKFEWLKTIRNPSFAIPAVLFPVIFYLFFGVLINANNIEASTYLLATYGTFGVMGPALFSFGSGLAVERGKGWLDIKEASPMPASAHIVSRIIVSMVFSFIIIISLGFVAFVVAGVNLTLSQSLLLLITLLLGGLPFCLLGLTLGFILKAESAAAIVNVIYLPMAFLSGLWLPINMLPSFLQSLANYLPPYHLSQLALKVTQQDMGGSVLNHLVMLALFSVIFLALAIMASNKRQA
ncbi:ABC transporter permease [Algibacillus agarilyticus]|uniref:ABC transporter permease n=1 Tax=Algibacillus agarilyticus TaxID=2234133 RepID=UPI000DD0EA03|nr:ABC transporter permease [Algibacillus agarilyticus]